MQPLASAHDRAMGTRRVAATVMERRRAAQLRRVVGGCPD